MTISGLLDAGFRSVDAAAGGDTSGAFQNGSAISTINIAGTEDLGGGLKANFRVELNPDFVGGSGVTGNVLEGPSTAPQVRTSSGGLHQTFLGVSGGFGEVKLGRLNSAALSAWVTGSAFGTALGSGYGSNGGMFTGASSSVANLFQTAPTRFNNAVEYTTPSFSGLTARLLYVPKVDNTGAGNTDNATVGTLAGANRAGVTDLGLAYKNGPLNMAFSQQQHKFGAQAVNALVIPGVSSNAANGDYKLTTLAANYTMGPATVYAAYWTEKQATVAANTVAVDVKAYMLGAKYVIGAIDLLASYGNRDDKSTVNVGTGVANVDRKIMGLGANYNLSKRTALWARYEDRDANTNSSADTSAAGKTKTTAVGVRHTF